MEIENNYESGLPSMVKDIGGQGLEVVEAIALLEVAKRGYGNHVAKL
jgi:hypothetical protein